MPCAEMSTMMDALIDGELDAPTAARLEAHARSCARCAALLADRRRLVGLLATAESRRAPAGLRRAVVATVGADVARPVKETAGPREGMRLIRASRWVPVAAALLLGLGGFWLGSITAYPRGGMVPGGDVAREAVSAHIRSLMATHLTDVAASDRHVVKPWFAGKVDFSPPVPDFAAEGFPLTGGRLDYLGARPVAAIVYKHKDHVINVFIVPNESGRAEGVRTWVDRGYQTATWTDGRTRFYVVSDVAPETGEEFVHLLRSRMQEADPPTAK